MERELAAIREKVIKTLPELIIQAEKMLKIKGCQVYLAADKSEAQSVLTRILVGQKQAVRSYSQTLREIGLDEFMDAKGIRVHKTSVTEIIMERLSSHLPGYPSISYINADREEVKNAIQRHLGAASTSDFQELRKLMQKKIKETIINSEFGITGVNSLAAENGTLILAEDEGNARVVSNLPYNHVVVAGIEKISGTIEESMTVIGGAALYGTGRKTPAYISLISGPSRTGDIEFCLAYGMHGPKEVHVILLDNGRKSMLEQGYGEILKCVDCGSCLGLCRELALENKWTGLSLTMKGICLALIQGRIQRPRIFHISGNFSCPAGIMAELFKEALAGLEPFIPVSFSPALEESWSK